MNGKLVIIEGTDATGKTTQFRMLSDLLTKMHKSFHTIQFPRYDKPSSALVNMYLNGEFGDDPKLVNPYAASLFFAVDRYASFLTEWSSYYENGELIISDRYTTSNAIYQAAKLKEDEVDEYLKWLSDLEYVRLKLPEPDLVLFLDMPTEYASQLLEKRTGKVKDIHETDDKYLDRCYKTAKRIAEKWKWVTIPCVANGQIRSKESVHGDILNALSKMR